MSRATVGIVDDDPAVLRLLDRLLERGGFERVAFGEPAALLALTEREPDRLDVVLSDIRMPAMDGMELLARLHERDPDLPVILMTADATVDSAVEAMKTGAFDYVLKPFLHPDEVIARLERAVERRQLKRRNRALERNLDVAGRFPGIVGSSAPLRDMLRMIESIAPTDATVLVLGESGTGKELAARAIHERSGRAARPFVAINCSTLTDTLLESELFGHAKGAFTGAVASRRGLLEEADRGTLFLDEVGDMPLATQARFLRVLQEGEIRPLGSNEVRKVDVRVIAATNADLRDAIQRKQFRGDLYYRLHVVALDLPPLRRRREDVPFLVQHFLAKYARQQGKPMPELEPGVIELLVDHLWPGNVRELENGMHRFVVLDRAGRISVADVEALLGRAARAAEGAGGSSELQFAAAKERAIEAFERRYLLGAMARAGGTVSEASRLAGLDRSNFRRLLRRHGIDAESGRRE